jgi:hypothetical protein
MCVCTSAQQKAYKHNAGGGSLLPRFLGGGSLLLRFFGGGSLLPRFFGGGSLLLCFLGGGSLRSLPSHVSALHRKNAEYVSI